MMPVSVQVPSRFGPRHCGQSAASNVPAIDHNRHAMSSGFMLCRLTNNKVPKEMTRESVVYIEPVSKVTILRSVFRSVDFQSAWASRELTHRQTSGGVSKFGAGQPPETAPQHRKTLFCKVVCDPQVCPDKFHAIWRVRH